jgi:hypothetical protein
VSVRRLALVVVVAALAAPAAGAARPAPGLVPSAAHVRQEVASIHQSGLLLGKASAPVQIIEYASLSCDTCARVHRAVVPAVIDRYVRTGIANLEFRGIGDTPRAQALAVGAYAASAQHHGWEFVQLAYLRLLSTDSPSRLAAALGLDAQRFRKELKDPEWPILLRGAESVLSVAQFRGDPVFLVRRQGQAFQVLTQPTTVREFTEAIVNAQRHA